MVLVSRTEHQPHQPGRREHVVGRPSWLCRVDGEPWPCDRAKADLREQYARSSLNLSIYMNSMMQEYIGEPGREPAGLDPAVLFGRFLAWMKPSDDG